MMKSLTTLSNSIDAALLQQQLDMEGIDSFLVNEHTTTMLPHLYGMLGHGIQVMVYEADYHRARQVIAQKEIEGRIQNCPHCGSADIGFGMGGKGRWRERLLIFFSLIFGAALGNIRNKYYCRHCREVFS